MIFLRYWRCFFLICAAGLSVLAIFNFFKQQEEMELGKIELDPGYFDLSGKYKVHNHVFSSEKLVQLYKDPLCIAVATTFADSHNLVDLVHSWAGAVSCALFVSGRDFHLAVAYVSHLRRCHTSVFQQVSFHFVYPADELPFTPVAIPSSYLSCRSDPEKVLQDLLSLRSKETTDIEPIPKAEPINLLRNVARTNCASTWVMCPDIGMTLPQFCGKGDFRQEIHQYLRKLKYIPLRAYILPAFEYKNSQRKQCAANKRELLQHVRAKQARPLDEHLQRSICNLDRWQQLPPRENVSTAFSVEKFMLRYAPVFIARQGTPKFDERYFGDDENARSSQAYEMMMANYTFRVLDNAFICKKQDYKRLNKEVEEHNSSLFATHLRELAVKYDRDPIGTLGAEGTHNVSVVLKNSTSSDDEASCEKRASLQLAAEESK